ncbi:MAG: DNA translocase FtsK 4TM domain-containing protein, partial [Alphaproteobacteria bacterium]|nr:DNA translocase FtsK 4TM domain-containing protein [Alphaproteobacteria bacterium]
MAQTQTIGRGRRSTWRLSAQVKAFARRRAREAAGLVLILAGLFLFFALLTHNPGDPSFNRAVEADPTNLFGHSGAAAADLALQLFALAAVLPVAALLTWGEYLLRHRRVGGVVWRLIALPLAFAGLVLALGLAGRMAGGTTDLDGWVPGGAVGGLAAAKATALLTVLYLPLWTGTAVAGLMAVLLSAVALPLTWGQWVAVASRIVREIGRGVAIAARAALMVGGFAARTIFAQLGGPASNRRRREPSLRGQEGADALLDDLPGAVLDTKRVAKKQPKLKSGRREKEGRQKKLDLPVPKNVGGVYQLPPLDLLAAPRPSSATPEIDREALEQNARLLESVLDDFGVRGEIVKVRPGPVVTMYELEPAPGTKTARVISLADDIARSMSAVSVRIAVVPGRNAIGIELPNALREMVVLRELLASDAFEKSKGLALALGKTIAGEPVFADLAAMPHLLIAGTTGSGKSVGVNAMIVSLLYRFTPDECRFIMVDPKMLELSIYDGIPHLLSPVVTDPKKAVVALKWVVREMENRYQSMSKLGVR